MKNQRSERRSPHILLAAALCMGVALGASAAFPAQSPPTRLQGSAPVPLAAPSDGQLIDTRPWRALPAYDGLDAVRRRVIPRDVYEGARLQQEFDVEAIHYGSDGLAVPGVLIRPKQPKGRQWPAIIYNRGGNGEFGRIGDLMVIEMYLLAKQGFVVAGSDYRFHGDTAMADQWGGVEVNDVMNVVPLLRALPEVDATRLYMVGVSRGGTMAYLALKRGIAVRAAAVLAGVADLEDWGRYRPELIKGNDVTNGWARNWPDFATRADEHYRERSAVRWPDKITVPLLLLHSRTDPLVHVDQSLRMALALSGAGRPYELHIYEDDGHGLARNRDDRNRRIVEWFSKAP